MTHGKRGDNMTGMKHYAKDAVVSMRDASGSLHECLSHVNAVEMIALNNLYDEAEILREKIENLFDCSECDEDAEALGDK